MSLPLRPSPAWDFFDKSNDSSHVTCRKCKAEFKFFGSTTVMIKHVEAHHRDDLNKMQQFKRKHGCNERSSLSEATDKFVLSLCTSNVPFNIVKNEHFRSFIHQLNPDYQLLTTDGIRRKLGTTAKVYRDSAKKTLKKANRCIITLDGWDGRFENTSLYALFLYFIDAEFLRHKLSALKMKYRVVSTRVDTVSTRIDMTSESTRHESTRVDTTHESTRHESTRVDASRHKSTLCRLASIRFFTYFSLVSIRLYVDTLL
ncbi:hypothetical protein B9Z55_021445 [Caenorhabditis nigoni]|uniref:BED-type domain-containing protein n=1 Tax=Caenorhabditis nigoni TaxID=1611254 RepID=A0A2G5TS43_9PELO|nr:hypothetical protein B9Z55_021445 [Caenorhabditis nigoni]